MRVPAPNGLEPFPLRRIHNRLDAMRERHAQLPEPRPDRRRVRRFVHTLAVDHREATVHERPRVRRHGRRLDPQTRVPFDPPRDLVDQHLDPCRFHRAAVEVLQRHPPAGPHPVQLDHPPHHIGVRLLPEGLVALAKQLVDQAGDGVRQRVAVRATGRSTDSTASARRGRVRCNRRRVPIAPPRMVDTHVIRVRVFSVTAPKSVLRSAYSVMLSEPNAE